MEEKILITETLFSSLHISLNMKPNIRCRFTDFFLSDKVQCYQLHWVQVIRAASSSRQERKINSPLEKHWSKLLMLLISPPVTHHVIFSKLIRVLIKLFLGYIIWINSCLLATQATKPHKLIPTKIIFLHLRYLDERRGLIRCLLSAPRA
uniref:FAD/NAD-P-binding oxidoreductase family protein n=1 Tax=Citrus limon TaxID=2708 RepID=A0A1S8ACQ7_CITLI